MVAGRKFIIKLKRFTLSLTSLVSISLSVACSQRVQQVQQPVAQSQTQQSQPAASMSTENTNQPATSSSQNAPEAQPTDIDGTYTGQDEGTRITLVVIGYRLELTGNKKLNQFSFDGANQRMIIDDMDGESSNHIVSSK